MLKRTNNKINLFFNIIYNSFYILCIIILLIILLQRISNNKTSIFGYQIFRISSNSMYPKYEVGDVILVRKEECKNIEEGDDLTYLANAGKLSEKVITHEVIKIEVNEDKYIYHTKGLANYEEDPLVEEEQIYGVVVKKIFILTILSKFIRTIYGFIIMVFIPIAIEISINIKKLKNESEQKNEK